MRCEVFYQLVLLLFFFPFNCCFLFFTTLRLRSIGTSGTSFCTLLQGDRGHLSTCCTPLVAFELWAKHLPVWCEPYLFYRFTHLLDVYNDWNKRRMVESKWRRKELRIQSSNPIWTRRSFCQQPTRWICTSHTAQLHSLFEIWDVGHFWESIWRSWVKLGAISRCQWRFQEFGREFSRKIRWPGPSHRRSMPALFWATESSIDENHTLIAGRENSWSTSSFVCPTSIKPVLWCRINSAGP